MVWDVVSSIKIFYSMCKRIFVLDKVYKNSTYSLENSLMNAKITKIYCNWLFIRVSSLQQDRDVWKVSLLYTRLHSVHPDWWKKQVLHQT